MISQSHLQGPPPRVPVGWCRHWRSCGRSKVSGRSRQFRSSRWHSPSTSDGASCSSSSSGRYYRIQSERQEPNHSSRQTSRRDSRTCTVPAETLAVPPSSHGSSAWWKYDKLFRCHLTLQPEIGWGMQATDVWLCLMAQKPPHTLSQYSHSLSWQFLRVSDHALSRNLMAL